MGNVVSVVDDDTSLRNALVRFAKSYGYNAVGFHSAEEFLSSGTISATMCVVSDIQMTGMSGLALAKLISNLRPDLPVVLITAHGEPEIEEAALACGAVCFLRKPIDADRLMECISSAAQSR